jgi:ABC-2 type transport system ATP-binding protein
MHTEKEEPFVDMLSVQNLCKKYTKFELKDVSFSLEPGYIMGFIGRNGAGKTTTLKAILNLVHTDSGSITVMGKEFRANELELKQKVGFILGGTSYYPKKRLRIITSVVRRFYKNWDESAYEDYLRRFELDESKRVDELSAGMKVKYALALALSHNASLLLLDEPTSGLDPVSRDDMLELFQALIEDGQRSILFSTQITSDLEKCADYVTYIREGRIVASAEKGEFLDGYRLVKGGKAQLTDALRSELIGFKEHAFGFTGLARAAAMSDRHGLEVSAADIESIMIYFERENRK